MVPAEQLSREIDERLVKGQSLLDEPVASEANLVERRQDYYTWSEYNEALLRRSFDLAKPAETYARLPGISVATGISQPLERRWGNLRDDISGKMRRLRSVQEQLRLYEIHPEAAEPTLAPDLSVLGEDVFIVHGHDGETKVAVARFLEKLVGREPIILHEQPDQGRTIIEKFEDHATRAGAAIVLLTADDLGGPKAGGMQPRARQNVVLELGFFLGKLGRGRVVILYGPGVELPSDLSGVLYVELDPAGAWRAAVARELEAAGLVVDLRALIK